MASKPLSLGPRALRGFGRVLVCCTKCGGTLGRRMSAGISGHLVAGAHNGRCVTHGEIMNWRVPLFSDLDELGMRGGPFWYTRLLAFGSGNYPNFCRGYQFDHTSYSNTLPTCNYWLNLLKLGNIPLTYNDWLNMDVFVAHTRCCP